MKTNPIDSINTLNKININNNRAKTDEFQKTLEAAQNSEDKEKLLSACQDFEALFINMMFKNMRNTIPKDGLIPKSFPQETFEGMLDEELSKEMTKGQGMGLAKQMYEQLTRKLVVPRDTPVVPIDKSVIPGSDEKPHNVIPTDEPVIPSDSEESL